MLDSSVRLAQLMPLMQERWAAGENVEFTPNGRSMLPMLCGGRDKVVLSPLPEKLNKYDLPLYRRDNGQFVLHRIVKVKESYTCIGDNQYGLEKGVRHDQMLALVTGFYHKGRYHSVDEFGYRAYSCLWHWTRPIRHFLSRCKNLLLRILTKVL